MKKWIIDVRESQVVDGEKTFTTSSHIVEGITALDARLGFASRAFPNERIVDVREAEIPTKVSKPVKH